MSINAKTTRINTRTTPDTFAPLFQALYVFSSTQCVSIKALVSRSKDKVWALSHTTSKETRFGGFLLKPEARFPSLPSTKDQKQERPSCLARTGGWQPTSSSGEQNKKSTLSTVKLSTPWWLEPKSQGCSNNGKVNCDKSGSFHNSM